jgi:opacity protein-like surface antigen
LTFSQQFGIKGGMNISSISDDGYDDTKSKVGYYGGVFVNIPASESFSIQPEVIYNNLGSEVKGTILGNSYSRKLNLNYITVPVMFQYKATPQFYLEAGPEFGFLVSADSKTTWNNSTSTAELDKDNFNNFNMGVGLGAGFDITKNVGINARYVAGFSDVTKPSSDPSTNAKNKNNTFQVGLNFKF